MRARFRWDIQWRPEVPAPAGFMDGNVPEGWYYRDRNGDWIGPWVDRDTAIAQKQGESL